MELKDMKIKTFKEFLEDKTNPVVYCLLSSNGKDFLAKESYKVELHQYNCQHDTFTIETPEDSFDAFNEYIMEHSRDLLGEPLTIKLYQYGKVVQHFSGIITRIYCKRQTGGGYGTLYISGNAPSILLDQGKTCNSYENKTLKEIIASVSEGYDTSAQVDTSAGVNTTRALPYTVQYNESDYAFICRLANLYGEYFYYDGSKLIFGNKLQETIDLGENLNLIDEDFNLEMKPQDFEYINYAIDRAEVYRKDAESACCEYKNNPIQTDAKNASKKLFKKIPQKYHSATSLEQSDIDLEEVVRQERDLRELSLKVTGRSRDPRLRMNTFACLTDINAHAMETYRVIKISHYHSGMNYENSFEAIPMMRTPADYNAEAFPKAEQQPAIVKDNNDPKGMGRVRVQFFWQKGDELSPWIRMIQPYAGSGKGFYFIPEVGEEVMVDFENGNAERPFVLGAHYNGAAKSGYNPTTKAIHTQSGTKILLNDAEGSVRIEDASHNIYEMDGQGNINLYAPNNICMNAGKDFDLNVGNNMTFTVGGQATMNILQKMVMETPLLKQIVAEYEARLGNALLSSDNQMKIEAKETNVAGVEKLFIHSDELATVNSKGLLEVKGQQGTKHSNKAEEYEIIETLPDTYVLVHFRTKKDWKGDFGFDCYKENSNVKGINDTEKYIDLVGKYYRKTDSEMQVEKQNNPSNTYSSFFISNPNSWYIKTDSSIIENFKLDGTQYGHSDESQNKLRKDFSLFNFKIKNKNDIEQNFTHYKSFIALFPKTENYGVSEAKIELQIKFLSKEKPDYLVFKLNDETKELTADHYFIGIDRLKIERPKSGKRETIKITCKASQIIDKDGQGIKFDKDIDIKIYAVKVDKSGNKTESLAGCITMIAPIVKTINILPVYVKTITSKYGNNEDNTFTFFKKALGQALIKVNLLEKDPNSIKGESFYLDLPAPYPFTILSKTITDNNGLDDFIKNEFERKYSTIYANYSKLYFLDLEYKEPNTEGAGGYFDSVSKCVMLFKGHQKETIAHECLHALGLPHSFYYPSEIYKSRMEEKIRDKNFFVFKAMETNNIMDYSHLGVNPVTKNRIDSPKERYLTWHWQWLIVRESTLLE